MINLSRDGQNSKSEALLLKSKVHRNLKKYMENVVEESEIGSRPHGTKYKSSFIFSHESKNYAVVCKFQFSQGSVDFKIPYEVISLAHCITSSPHLHGGFLVLAGNGYSKGMKQFILSDLRDWIVVPPTLVITTYDDFIRRVRSHNL